MAKDTAFLTKKTLNLGGSVLSIDTPLVMGILNVTPDSFFDGGNYIDDKSILQQCEQMREDGAAIIDVGGYSSRPGATDISEQEEINRVTKAIKAIIKTFPDTIISIDTFRAAVAEAAVSEGASLVNDISAGSLDAKMFETVASLKVPYIMMHMKGSPQNMQGLTSYDDLLKEMVDYFVAKIIVLKEMGVKDIIVDPGFGFAKTIEQNYEILRNLNYFQVLNQPLLVGVSRKSMIYKLLEIQPEDALNGTTVLNTMALMNGAGILRVHDVKEAVEAIQLFKAVTL